VRALYDRAIDVALLHHLALAGATWQEGPELLRVALDWIDMREKPLGVLLRTTYSNSMNATLRVLQERGLVESQPGPFGGIEWRLHPDTTSGDLKRLTGGINPLLVDQDECLALDMPAVEAARRVEFDPRGYLKVPGDKAKENRVIWQCPSIWELGARMKTIDDRKHTVKVNRKEDEDERPIAAAA